MSYIVVPVEATGEGKEALYFATEYPYDAAIVEHVRLRTIPPLR